MVSIVLHWELKREKYIVRVIWIVFFIRHSRLWDSNSVTENKCWLECTLFTAPNACVYHKIKYCEQEGGRRNGLSDTRQYARLNVEGIKWSRFDMMFLEIPFFLYISVKSYTLFFSFEWYIDLNLKLHLPECLIYSNFNYFTISILANIY